MKRGRKVPKYSCHTSLDMPQHSKWSSPLHLARAIVYQGKLRFLSMPFFWLYEPLPTKIPREVPDLQVFLHNQIFNPFKQDPQFERMIPDSFWVLCMLKSSKGLSNSWGGGEEMGGRGSNGKPSGYQSAPWNHQGWNPYFPTELNTTWQCQWTFRELTDKLQRACAKPRRNLHS